MAEFSLYLFVHVDAPLFSQSLLHPGSHSASSIPAHAPLWLLQFLLTLHSVHPDSGPCFALPILTHAPLWLLQPSLLPVASCVTTDHIIDINTRAGPPSFSPTSHVFHHTSYLIHPPPPQRCHHLLLALSPAFSPFAMGCELPPRVTMQHTSLLSNSWATEPLSTPQSANSPHPLILFSWMAPMFSSLPKPLLSPEKTLSSIPFIAPLSLL